MDRDAFNLFGKSFNRNKWISNFFAMFARTENGQVVRRQNKHTKKKKIKTVK